MGRYSINGKSGEIKNARFEYLEAEKGLSCCLVTSGQVRVRVIQDESSVTLSVASHASTMFKFSNNANEDAPSGIEDVVAEWAMSLPVCRMESSELTSLRRTRTKRGDPT